MVHKNCRQPILLVADIQDLKADAEKQASGIVLEARLDRSRGIVATILVQSGTLRVGDPFIAGTAFGKVRAMIDENGRRVDLAGPSTPVEVMGFQSEASAGDLLQDVADEVKAQLAQTKNLNDFFQWLKAHNIPVRATQTTKAAEQLPLEILPRLPRILQFSEVQLRDRAEEPALAQHHAALGQELHVGAFHPYASRAAPTVVAALERRAAAAGARFVTGATVTAPGFFGPSCRHLDGVTATVADIKRRLGRIEVNGVRVVNMEMESSRLFHLAALLGIRAGTIRPTISSPASHGTVLDPAPLVRQAIEIALLAMHDVAEGR